MKNTNFEAITIDNVAHTPDLVSIIGRFKYNRNPVKCLEGKNTVWLFRNTASAIYKKAAKTCDAVVVENVSEEYIDSLQKTLDEYSNIGPKLGWQCHPRAVFTRVRSTLTPRYTTVDY